VKLEMRENLIAQAARGEPRLPRDRRLRGHGGPGARQRVLARHNFILLGLRGQAKSRILRQLVELLDPEIPVLAGSEVNDDPFAPISKYGAQLVEEMGDDAPIAWRARGATWRSWRPRTSRWRT
jgi:magnesium chelatase subunit I